MDNLLVNFRKQFPSLPQNALINIYSARFERLRMLMHKGIPADLRWFIEAKVRLNGELSDALVSYMPGLGKSLYAKKRRAKRLQVCHKCARWTCNTKCKSLGMVSINRADKINFIKDGMSKESLDNILLTLETHPSGDVQRALLDLWPQFQAEYARYSLGNLTQKDPVCQSLRNLEEKPTIGS